MNTTDLNHEWIRLSPAWIKQARTHTMPSRDGLLDKPMLAACGDVRGLSILDSGCGEGRFCRILLDRGAERVLGVDLCATRYVSPNRTGETQSGLHRGARVSAGIEGRNHAKHTRDL